jgi:hypothetical protein
MVLAFVSGYPGATTDEQFTNQVEIEGAMADELTRIDTELEIRPFSFALLLTGVDDFTSEVGQLFALAFAVILLILLFVYWLSPGKEGSWFASVRRTITDMLLTLLTIVMAIGIMQGGGYLLEQIGVIDAFSAPTQIVPILLIGLGVDYAIHLTSRYREVIGQGDVCWHRAVPGDHHNGPRVPDQRFQPGSRPQGLRHPLGSGDRCRLRVDAHVRPGREDSSRPQGGTERGPSR